MSYINFFNTNIILSGKGGRFPVLRNKPKIVNSKFFVIMLKPILCVTLVYFYFTFLLKNRHKRCCTVENRVFFRYFGTILNVIIQKKQTCNCLFQFCKLSIMIIMFICNLNNENTSYRNTQNNSLF